MPRQANNLVGLRFGKLTVMSRTPNRAQEVAWRCRCDCGTETIVLANNLRRGWWSPSYVDVRPGVTAKICKGQHVRFVVDVGVASHDGVARVDAAGIEEDDGDEGGI
jgi:hypothetical protein